MSAWPLPLDVVLGAGCTDPELCVRFGSEDLRRPIIQDNVMDDQILKTNMNKHNMTSWFTTICATAKALHEAQDLDEQASEDDIGDAVGEVNEDMDEVMEEEVEEVIDVQQSVEE